MANSIDPDQLASSEANWSGSTLFAKQDISGFSRTRVKTDHVMNKFNRQQTDDIYQIISCWNFYTQCKVLTIFV